MINITYNECIYSHLYSASTFPMKLAMNTAIKALSTRNCCWRKKASVYLHVRPDINKVSSNKSKW